MTHFFFFLEWPLYTFSMVLINCIFIYYGLCLHSYLTHRYHSLTQPNVFFILTVHLYRYMFTKYELLHLKSSCLIFCWDWRRILHWIRSYFTTWGWKIIIVNSFDMYNDFIKTMRVQWIQHAFYFYNIHNIFTKINYLFDIFSAISVFTWE